MKVIPSFHNAVMLAGMLAALTSVSSGADDHPAWRDGSLYRDEWGTPHVYADNPFALGYIFGYAQAEDHAEEMLLAYRMANGRLAAALGEPFADSDAFSLKMGHARLAEEALGRLDEVTVALCEGFATGVNAWLTTQADALPFWMDGVRPADILALWHAFLMSMAPFDLQGIYRRPPAMHSGTAWATMPSRSPDNQAILVINPHQHHDGFFQWYEARLVLGDMNMYGVTLRGLPIILQGHNETLGWALTPNQPDFADIYTEDFSSPERRNPKDPRISPQDDNLAVALYYMSQAQPYYVKTEGGLETRFVPAYIGPRGPLFEHPNSGLHSWLIGGYSDFGGLRQLYEMGRARTLEAFQQALFMQQIPCFHVVYADREGNIFYLYNTKAGLRMTQEQTEGEESPAPVRRPTAWSEPLSGELAAIAWHAVFTPDQLPRVINPASGYIQAAGTTPWKVSDDMPIDPAGWPAWLVKDQDSYRAKRIRQLLQGGLRNFRDHQSMLFDVVAGAAFDMVPALLRAAEQRRDILSVAHPDFLSGMDLLRNWNFIAEIGSPGMTFYHLWWVFARMRALSEFPTEFDFQAALFNGLPLAQEIGLRAAEEAARTLRNEYQRLDVPWGEVHRIRRGSRDEPIFGAATGDPIFLASDYIYEQGKWLATYGYGFAMVTQFGDRPESVSLLPFGASQRPDSPHFSDQLNLMLERRFKQVRFDHDDILRHAEFGMGKSVTLLPAGITGAVTFHSPMAGRFRLNTTTEAPAPLPQGFIPFSLYMQPERAPKGAPATLEISIFVPDVLCDATGFAQLTLFRYEPGLGWHAAPRQRSVPERRLLYTHDEPPAPWYAVLGPVEAALGGVATTFAVSSPPTSADPGITLDALLQLHMPSPGFSERPRTFRFERLDQPESFDISPAPESTKPYGPLDVEGRIFRLERHDQPKEGLPPTFPDTSAGPQAPTPTQDTDKPQGVEKQESLPAPREALPGETAVPSAPDAPEPDSSVASPPKPAPDPPQAERPPLPDVIPRDPAFVFGPSGLQNRNEPSDSSPTRIFRIEREEP